MSFFLFAFETYAKFVLIAPFLPLPQVRLEWPTDLAVSPMDNSLYVLDNNVVLQISENHQVTTRSCLHVLLLWVK